MADNHSGTSRLFELLYTDFYDGKIIRIPKGKCLRRIGPYYDETPQGKEKIVPVVDIYDE